MTMATNRMTRMLAAARERLSGTAPEREMDEEMRFHLEMATRRNVERGMAPDEARRQALATFGGETHHQETAKDGVPGQWLDGFRQDLKYAVRTLRRNKGFAAAVVLTLALGIGANTAIFSVVNGVLLRPLPVPNPHEIVMIGWDFGKGTQNQTLSAYEYDYLRRHNRSFVGVTTHRMTSRELGEAGQTRMVGGIRVAGDFFRVIGYGPALGRAFADEEYRPGGPSVAILSDALWRTEFAADRSIIGRVIRLEGKPVTVVGVMPTTFRFPGATLANSELLLPYQLDPDPADQGHNYIVMARVRGGVTTAQIQADLEAAKEALRAEHPEIAKATEHYLLMDWQEVYVGDLENTLLIMLGAVAFVLLIAAVNAANLLLARGAAREREIIVRAALGAGRLRIVRQLLGEGLVLSGIAGTLGLVLGMWGVRVLLALMPNELPRVEEIGLDQRVLAFTMGIVLLTTLVFGVAAALPTRRLNLAAALGERMRGSGANRQTRDLLVMSETAFAIVLLAGAGLLITSFAKLRGVDPGFSPENVTAVRFGRMPEGFEKTAVVSAFEQQLIERIEGLPGVERAAGLSNFPLERGYNLPVSITGSTEEAEGAVEWRAITPGYFETLRIRVIRGRVFGPADERNAPKVVIINEAFANRYFPGQDPIGKRLDIGRYKDQWMRDEFREPVQIVGLVADMREIRLDRPGRFTVFVPAPQAQDGMISRPLLVVRSRGDNALRAGIETAVREVDARVAPPTIEMFPRIVSASIAEPRFQATLLSVFAGSALVLTAIGIFGVVSYGVQQRVREIGVRVALGARAADVLRLVVGRSLAFVSAGAEIGVVGAFGLTRFLSGRLYGVTATDPATFAAAVGVLLGVALVASYLPARRAAHIDPVVALRLE